MLCDSALVPSDHETLLNFDLSFVCKRTAVRGGHVDTSWVLASLTGLLNMVTPWFVLKS